ncbi:MAG: hypothetical protein NZM28_03915 [Fimbriimonadales bacterium]|nr:hypothetical protein [Fimbriimonadales bacterium]
MLWLYRFLWIASSVGTVALLIVASSPRAEQSPIREQWTTVQQGRFTAQVPYGFSAHRDALTQMGMNKPNSPVQLQDAVRIERGARTGAKAILVTIRTDLQPTGGEASATPEQQAARLLRQVHETQLQNLGKVFADLKITQNRAVRVQGVYGLRSDYEFTLTHWIPFFHLPARGYIVTVPVSSSEALHFVAYSPPHQFEVYQPVYERILNTLKLNAGGANTASGGE